jgi:hypothetical protein
VSNLEAPVDLGRFSGLSLLEIEAVKTQAWPHVFGCDQPAWKCEACHEDLKAVRRVIAAVQPMVEQDHLVDLSAAGRLLPEGAEHDVKVVLRWYDGAGRLLDHWGAADVGTARRLGQRTHPSKAVRGEIRTRESWVGPWSVVEPVEVSEP